jgi:predicted small secreted protein
MKATRTSILALAIALVLTTFAACTNTNAEIGGDVAEPIGTQPLSSHGTVEKSKTGLEHVGEILNRSYYVVWDEAGLRELASSYEDDAAYSMQNDIQLSAEEWIPIGTEEKPFRGWFLGNTHTISGLTMTDPDAEVIGLFGFASDALISDLTLREVDISRAGSNVAEEKKSDDPICAVRNGECRFGPTEVYLKESDVNIAPKLTEEEAADLESYINGVLGEDEK